MAANIIRLWAANFQISEPQLWLRPPLWLYHRSVSGREPGSGTRAMFERALKKRGVRLSNLTVQLEP